MLVLSYAADFVPALGQVSPCVSHAQGSDPASLYGTWHRGVALKQIEHQYTDKMCVFKHWSGLRVSLYPCASGYVSGCGLGVLFFRSTFPLWDGVFLSSNTSPLCCKSRRLFGFLSLDLDSVLADYMMRYNPDHHAIVLTTLRTLWSVRSINEIPSRQGVS